MAWEYPSFEKSEVKGRLAAALFAVSWAVLPGFGVIDLSVTVQPAREWQSSVAVNAGWGLLTTVLLGGAFAWTALRPLQFAVAAVQIVAVAIALTVAAVAGSESGAFVLGALAVSELLVVRTLLPVRIMACSRSVCSGRLPRPRRSRLDLGSRTPPTCGRRTGKAERRPRSPSA